MLDPEDDIEADIRAAMSGSDPAPAAPAAEVVPVATIPDPKAEPVADKAAARAPDGKFAKAPEPVQDAPQVTAPSAPEQQPVQSVLPPNGWTAGAKAIFNDLPPLAREEIARRELDMSRGVQKLQAQIASYAPLEEALAPHKDEWALQGVDSVTAVRQLLSAHQALKTNPTQAIEFLARQYGAQVPQFGAPQQAANPEMAALQQQLQTMQAQLQQRETAEQQRSQTELQSQIEAFQADPANLYFENVKPHMAALLRDGRATDLKDAYDQAVWANPETRGLMLADQQKQAQASVLIAAQSKAKEAGRSSGSLNGSASGTAMPTSTGDSIEDDIRAAFALHSGRA